MPRGAPSPCRSPGCPEITHSGYCADHIKEAMAKRQMYQRRARRRRAADAVQQKLDSFYHSSAWKACRRAYISAHPLCVVCASRGTTKAADVVDHIVERRDGGADFDYNNLQALCHGCHNEKTQVERRLRATRTP